MTFSRAGLVLFSLIAAFVVFAWWWDDRDAGKIMVRAARSANRADDELAARLRGHVIAIATTEHNLREFQAYEAAAAYIEQQLSGMAYKVRRDSYDVNGARVANLDVEIPGSDPGAGIIVVGAHYDSVEGAPGAKDNVSVVASTLELARLFSGWKPPHTWRFVWFANEEPPYFQTGQMGKRGVARALKADGKPVAAMFSLETLGYYSDRPGSQRYPFPFGLAYSDRGDFVAFVGNLQGRALARAAVGTFREKARFPSEGAAAPSFLPGVDWSDHGSFWREGWPALMITDTAPFRYPHYHTAQDTPDKVDYPRLAQVVRGLEATFRSLDAAL